MLSNTRSVIATMGGAFPAPINLSEIAAYLALFPTDDQDEFVQYLQVCDRAFLAASAKQQAAKKVSG
jgi:hypothetical protein